VNWEQIATNTFAVVLTAIVAFGILAAAGNHFAQSAVRRLVVVERDEIGAMLIAAFYFFCTMMSYSLLRPVRDEFAVATGTRDLPNLFLATLGTMLVITPLWGALVARQPVRRFMAIVYQIVAFMFVLFFVALRTGFAPTFSQWAFFAWLTVWVVFGASLFWSVMADTFSSEQAKRLFGFIGVGGTVGFVSGSFITSFFTDVIGRPGLMLISAALVLIAATLAGVIPRVAPEGGTLAAEQKRTAVIGGSAFAAAKHVLTQPYLAMIALFLFLYTFGSTVIYFAQTDIVGAAYADRTARTEILARLDLTTQLITAFGQMFFTARAMRSFGLSFTIAAVPIVSILGFAALGLTASGIVPLVATIMVFSVGRRAAEYMLTQPSRKVLFTVMSREDKYKTSNFLETFVYRAGDQLSGYGYAGLAKAGLSLAQISWVAVPVSAAFLAAGLWLAKQQRMLAKKAEQA
jgi:AAA family ATP:ADP antiporter